MKTVTGMYLGLENLEQIHFRDGEVKELGVEGITQQVAKFESGTFQFDSCAFLHFTLDAKANHTYNSLGDPSELTVFDRLMEVNEPVGCVTLVYDNGTTQDLYLPHDMEQTFSVNKYGDLMAVFGYDLDEDIEDPYWDPNDCCGCCEE